MPGLGAFLLGEDDPDAELGEAIEVPDFSDDPNVSNPEPGEPEEPTFGEEE